jgi:hypothetical protein
MLSLFLRVPLEEPTLSVRWVTPGVHVGVYVLFPFKNGGLFSALLLHAIARS